MRQRVHKKKKLRVVVQRVGDFKVTDLLACHAVQGLIPVPDHPSYLNPNTGGVSD